MKPIIKIAVVIFLTSASSVLLVACSKEKPTISTNTITLSSPSPDTLKGKELIFTNLIWIMYPDIDSVIFASVDKRPDLFFNNWGRPIEVSIRLDTSNIWIQVPAWNTPVPSHSGYLYNWSLPRIPNPYNPYFYFFQVLPEPYNFQLVGNRVSIKVKFL